MLGFCALAFAQLKPDMDAEIQVNGLPNGMRLWSRRACCPVSTLTTILQNSS
jgi:hypothetical protein